MQMVFHIIIIIVNMGYHDQRVSVDDQVPES